MHNKCDVAVPHPTGVVVFSATVKQVGEIRSVSQSRVSKGGEKGIRAVPAARAVVQVLREVVSTFDLYQFSEICQHPQAFRHWRDGGREGGREGGRVRESEGGREGE